jgi:AcrR family transcriptional regulator
MALSPANISHGSDNPAANDPASVDPASVDPASVDPASVDPAARHESPDAPNEVSRRKRGEELEQAILQATVEALATCSYAELSIESVAARAQTGKASIYRRWPTKQDLVTETLVGLCSGPLAFATDAVTDDDISTRDALLQVLIRVAALMTGPVAPAMRAIWSEAMRDSVFAETIDREFFAPRRTTMVQLLERGVRRGEVRPDVRPEYVHDTIGGALSNRILLRGTVPSDEDLAHFLDNFVMPAIQPTK